MRADIAPEQPSFHIAPPGWQPDHRNPFVPDGSYGPAWSCWLIHTDDSRGLYGRRNGLFCQGVTLHDPCMPRNLADFLRYEARHERQVIIAGPDGLDLPELVRQALQHPSDSRVVRPADPRWIVHSTTGEAWERIQRAGSLKSLARLRREHLPVPGIGFDAFGEPADYAEHVMLGPLESIGSEIVVNSFQQGRPCYDEDAPYTPGARLYFDTRRIIHDGLAVRDGVHKLKIRDHLPLQPYLLAAATPEQVDPAGSIASWTPRTFLARANAWFAASTQPEDTPCPQTS